MTPRPIPADPNATVPAHRRLIILGLVFEKEYVTTEELRAATGVSPSTVHRDLARLAGAGLIRRLHGGATLPPAASRRR